MPDPPHARVLHIDITGLDQSGVTHSLTSILAGSEIRILDIGQAVIHDALALGILVELTEDWKSSPLLTDLLLKAHELGVQVRFTAISEQEYPTWVEGQSKRRFLITVIGPNLTAVHLAEVSGIVARAGLNIDRIDLLSGRTPLDASSTPNRICVELAVSGQLSTKTPCAHRSCS